jgi:hypothetical protein
VEYALYALMARENSTLIDVEKLLSRSDDTFRQEIIRTSEDEQTRYFFESTYPSFPKDAHLPITTCINRLVRPKMVRTLLCQPGQCFNFRHAMEASITASATFGYSASPDNVTMALQ